MENQEKVHAPSDKEEIASVGSGRAPIDFFGTVIFFVVLVQAFLMIGLNLYQLSQVSKANAELIIAKQTLDGEDYKRLNTEIEEVLAGNDKLQQVLASKVKWSNFYRQFNAVTPKNVRLKAMSVSENGNFKADGETADFTSLARAVVAWRDGTSDIRTPFSSVTLTNNGYQSDGANRRVSFSLSGQINIGGLK